MKGLGRNMTLFIAFAIIALLGLMALVRLAPVDPAVWNVAPPAATNPAQGVQPFTGGARADLTLPPDQARATLAALDRIATQTPRTRRLAGSVDEGRITWETRSALWGFPDYTTAQITPMGLTLYARLRFGREDMGVNAARLRAWLAALA